MRPATAARLGGLAVVVVAIAVLVAQPRTGPAVRQAPTPTASGTQSEGTPGPGESPSGTARAWRWFDHAYLIVLENRGADQVVGNTTEAPYLNGLIAGAGLASNYHAVAHPSEPNYFTLVAGSTFDIHDDSSYDLDAPSIFDQLEAAGRTWHVYAQGYPGGCFLDMEAESGPDRGPAGTYVRRHNPAISFTRVSGDPARCSNITALGAFDPAAADFEMIVPNNSNNMHDGSIRQGDDFLASIVPDIVSSPAFRAGALFITWDEGDSNEQGGGRVPMIVVRPGLDPGFASPVLHTHPAFLRTLEDNWGLACLAEACQADPLSEFFGR
jgi:acid phosphatase